MPNARAAAWPPPGEQTELLSLLEQFDRAWQGQTPPRIDEFLPPGSGTHRGREGASRRERLEELIKIDLEYRWRRATTAEAESPTRASDEAGARSPIRCRCVRFWRTTWLATTSSARRRPFRRS